GQQRAHRLDQRLVCRGGDKQRGRRRDLLIDSRFFFALYLLISLSPRLLVSLSSQAPASIVAQQRAAHAIQLLLYPDIAKVRPALLLGQAADQLIEELLGALAPDMLLYIRWYGEIHAPPGRVVEQQRGAGRDLGAALRASH